jgi:hypothetical protein
LAEFETFALVAFETEIPQRKWPLCAQLNELDAPRANASVRPLQIVLEKTSAGVPSSNRPIVAW